MEVLHNDRACFGPFQLHQMRLASRKETSSLSPSEAAANGHGFLRRSDFAVPPGFFRARFWTEALAVRCGLDWWSGDLKPWFS